MDLQEVVTVLKEIASPSLAGSWDNVGLLVEPSPPHQVCKILLTNDLTPPVVEEAVREKADMIISYHPPIFAPLKRITQGSWKERIIARCLENRIAMYSPHTSWDAARSGVNDWLINACGDVAQARPLEQTEAYRDGLNKKVTFVTSSRQAESIARMLEEKPGVEITVETLPPKGPGDTNRWSGSVQDESESSSDTDRKRFSILYGVNSSESVVNALGALGITFAGMEFSDLAKVPSQGVGMGRIGCLDSPMDLETAVTRIKQHLGLQHVQLAKAEGVKEISTVAVCAGSGSSVLRGVKADLYLTGEMSHHEILDAVYRGTHVILCNHSNTERGFLHVIQTNLSQLLNGKVEVIVSQVDRDPLMVV